MKPLKSGKRLTDKMKILLVVTKSDIGGAQVFVLNLAGALKKLGCEVEVAAGDGNYLFEELKKKQINCYYLNSLKRDFNLYNAAYFILELYRLLKSNKYHIVHLNSSNTLIGAVSAFMLKHRPATVFTFHGLSYVDKNYEASTFFKFLARIYFKIFLKAVDKKVFECKLNYDEMKEAVKLENAPIIYNGLDENDLHFLSCEEARKFLSSKCNFDLSRKIVIGSTGRLTYQKNYEFLINSFLNIKKKIPEAKVVIIGDGPDYQKYKSKIENLGMQNDFFLVGELKDSHQYMRGFDVFTLTSRYEGVSISLLEAIYSLVPILVSYAGGNPDVVGFNEDQ